MPNTMLPTYPGVYAYPVPSDNKENGVLRKSHVTAFRIGQVSFAIEPDTNFFYIVADARGKSYRVTKLYNTRRSAVRALNKIKK